ncbi:hypothetical protein L2E82_07927 [Cichorium intybus]|uniref:Uncharacterized protein n=1 Tax=Cichorium intybus TaxID=13427 RepID=A0ACB9G560_CICIN|nr:hypothetical protein L2E82_07927 [Cichorium intybus]
MDVSTVLTMLESQVHKNHVARPHFENQTNVCGILATLALNYLNLHTPFPSSNPYDALFHIIRKKTMYTLASSLHHRQRTPSFLL